MVYGLTHLKDEHAPERVFLKGGLFGEGEILYNPDREGKPVSVHVATAYIKIPLISEYPYPDYGPYTMLQVNAGKANWLKMPSDNRNTNSHYCFRDFVGTLSAPKGIVTVKYGVPPIAKAPSGWSPIQLYCISDFGTWGDEECFDPDKMFGINRAAWQLD